MSYLITLSITLAVIMTYNGIVKNIKGYSNMIETLSPSWNVSINIF